MLESPYLVTRSDVLGRTFTGSIVGAQNRGARVKKTRNASARGKRFHTSALDLCRARSQNEGAEDGMNVEEIMTRSPTTLGPDEPLAAARREMTRGGIRHLPIVDRAGRLVGLITQRDLITAGTSGTVGEHMRSELETVAPATAAHEAAYLLIRHRIGCVPVTEADGRLVGIVTETDFVRIAYGYLGGRVPVDELEDEEHESERR
jgi:CBS domain-containing protein